MAGAIRAGSSWLESAGVPHAVIGGIAASLHGQPRLTKDVDFVAIADEAAWPGLIRQAKKHGLRPRIADALEFARTTRVLLLVHDPTAIELDVSFGMLPFEHALVRRARPTRIGALRFPVAAAEDIIVMKALALRPRDIADIEGILRSKARLSLSQIRKHLAELSAALETKDHLAEFEKILKSVKR